MVLNLTIWNSEVNFKSRELMISSAIFCLHHDTVWQENCSEVFVREMFIRFAWIQCILFNVNCNAWSRFCLFQIVGFEVWLPVTHVCQIWNRMRCEIVRLGFSDSTRRLRCFERESDVCVHIHEVLGYPYGP